MEKLIKSKLLTVLSVSLIFAFLSPNILGQGKKDLHKKLDKIDGKVKKISIQTDKGTIDFTGKEAEEILKRLKKKENKFVFTVDGDDVFDKHHNVMFFSDDDDIFDVEKDGLSKKVKVEIVDGKKEVTVETAKDGKTTKKVLKGKEAEEYLKKNKIRSKHFLWKDKKGKRLKKFEVKTGDNVWFSDDDDVVVIKDKMRKHFKGKNNIEKEIEVKVKGGVKEVTVTTTKEGKKTVKKYKGKEAEEFLENLNDDDDIDINIDTKDHHKKIIILKKETKKDKIDKD